MYTYIILYNCNKKFNIKFAFKHANNSDSYIFAAQDILIDLNVVYRYHSINDTLNGVYGYL